MRWNWQQPDWPNFTYDAQRLRSREDRFLRGAGWTCNGFVPVTYLIKPPWLRRRAG